MPLWKIDVRNASYRNGAKDAAKRHKTFAKELKAILEEIERDPMSVGDQIRCLDSDAHTRKARIGCPRESVPPRKGYRLIFQVVEAKAKIPQTAIMLDCYYKPNQADIGPDGVKRLIDLALPLAFEDEES